MKHFVWYVQDFNVHKHLHFLSNLCDDRALKAIMRLFSQVQTDMEYMCLCCNTSAFKCRYRDLYSHVPFLKFLLFSCVMNGWLLGWHAAIYTVNCLYANILLFIKGNLRNSKHGAHWKCCGYRMRSRAANCASVSQDEILPCPETVLKFNTFSMYRYCRLPTSLVHYQHFLYCTCFPMQTNLLIQGLKHWGSNNFTLTEGQPLYVCI